MNSVWNVDMDSITNVVSKIAIIAAIVMLLDTISNPSNNQAAAPKLVIKRKGFTQNTKNSVLFRQGFLCNSCKRPLDRIQDFHHKNGNRANNHLSNCEALCPNCHARKTRRQ